MAGRNEHTRPKLRIAIIGMGSVGSTFALQLARAGGHRITAVARPGSLRLEQLRRDGGVVTTDHQQVELEVSDGLEEQVPYDLVLVTLLAHQVTAVVPALRRSAAKAILFMFNNFEPEQLRDDVGAERCSFEMPFVQARLGEDGKLTAKIGAAGQKSKIDHRHWVEVFNSAGLPAVHESNMFVWLRCQVPLGAAFESVSVAAMRRGGGASWKEAVTIARGAKESFTLIQRLGYRVYPAGKAFFHASPAFVLAGVLWSMSRVRPFRELLATGVNECRALVEAMLASALRLEHPVSVETIAAMKPTRE